MNQKPLSLKEFKHWLSDNQNGLSNFFNINREQIDEEDEFAGKEVRPKVGESKLLERIDTEDDPVQLVREFLESGGTVLAVEDKKISIEVESGEFTIPRFCVRIKKD